MSYIAITIGPIYKTLLAVRKTREVWAASYLFSWVSKLLIEHINSIESNAVYMPYYNKSSRTIGIGLYPDRIFIKSDRLSLSEIDDAIEDVYKTIASDIDLVRGNSNAVDFIRKYISIYTVQYNITTEENPVLIGNKLLDSAELRSTWQLDEEPNQLYRFFRQVNTLKTKENKKWITDHLNEQDIYSENRFESLIEIATRPIREKNIGEYKKLVKKYCYTDAEEELDDKEDPFVSDLKAALNTNEDEVFKNYHKYVCVVKADGDHVGRYLKSVYNNGEEELNKMSKALYEWGTETNDLIKEYSGVTVYVGGDDVLFFAPVVGNGGVNIIQLCEKINDNFKEKFNKGVKDEDGDIAPTLSFGVSVTYYKFPLNEALAKAGELLKQAKKTRHTICITLLKHSGATFDMALPLDETDDLNKAFISLLPLFKNDDTFVNSLIYHFREHESVYRLFPSNKTIINNYLKFNFDDNSYTDLVEQTSCLLVALQNKYDVLAGDIEKSKAAMQEIFSMLRMLKFLNGHDDGK